MRESKLCLQAISIASQSSHDLATSLPVKSRTKDNKYQVILTRVREGFCALALDGLSAPHGQPDKLTGSPIATAAGRTLSFCLK